MIEYNPRENKFPFFNKKDESVVLSFDNHEDLYEIELIYSKIVEKFPTLQAEQFYGKLNQMKGGPKPAELKQECDKLLKNIRNCLADEQFIHQIHDRYGLGAGKVVETLYAVYGYYFYTGKRTANVIKKTFDGYKKRPVY